MSFDLHVSLLRPIVVEELFSSTRKVLGDLTALELAPEIQWEYPPNPRVRVMATDFLLDGVSFYVKLKERPNDSLVQFSVSALKQCEVDEPPFAAFSVHNFPGQNVLALAMALATAKLAGSKVEDGSSHWLAEEINEPGEVLANLRLARSPADLSSALAKIDEQLNWKNRVAR